MNKHYSSTTGRRPVRMAAIVLLMVAVMGLVGLTPAYADPGDLDPTFGDNGIVITDIGDDDQEFYAVTIQPDGKIVAAGHTSSGIVVARYHDDGTLDPSFSGDGIVTTAVSGYASSLAVILQADGKIVAVGRSVLARYHSDGTPDTSFGVDGIVTSTVGAISSAAIQPDGLIVVAGYNGNDAIVARYNGNGSLDTTFGSGGIVVTDIDESYNYIVDVLIQPDGKIVAVGDVHEGNSAYSSFVLYRYTPDGALDPSFGTNGIVTIDFGSDFAYAYALALQLDGRIIAAGFAQDPDNPEEMDFAFGLARYNADGTPDMSFGTDGRVTTNIGPGNDHAASLALQEDDKIVAVGYSEYESGLASAILRYNADGSLDTSFSEDGIVTTPVGTVSYGIDTIIQSDNKIVVAGCTSESGDEDDNRLLLMRYLADDDSPAAPVLVSPANGSTVSDTTPTFDWEDVAGAAEYQIQVADDDGFTDPAIDTTTSDSTYTADTMLPDGAYYWRARAGDGSVWGDWSSAWPVTVAGGDFTVIVLPDTQIYAEEHPEVFTAQTQWIVENREALNIVYVAHEGDIVNNYNSITEWERANTSMSLLEDPVTTGLADGIPYGVIPGNHDLNWDTGETIEYNTYFGVSRFEGRGYYGGHYGTNNDNNYTLFNAGGIDFIVINIGYADEGPSVDILSWADALLKANPDRRGIVVSHYLLETDGSFGPPGELIYHGLKDNPNLFLMLAGHMHGVSRRVDAHNGYAIRSLMADFQDVGYGGEGFLRMMTFSPANDTIQVQTYSPTLDEYMTDADNQFTLPLDNALELSPGWVAYNDCVHETGEPLGSGVTTIGLDESGALIDQSTGIPVGVTVTLAGSGNAEAGSTGENTAAGTDAYSTFAGLANMEGMIGYGSSSGWAVDLTVSGLDPDKQYLFATSASRNGSGSEYADRYTRFTLQGVDSATNTGTPGIDVIDNLTVSFNTGTNHTEGYVARWQDIDPGLDGAFTVRAEPQDLAAEYRTYAFSVFMLHEQTPPPSAPVLLAPAHESTTPVSTPAFDWEDVADATQYQIQVDDDPGFSNPEVDTMLAASTYTPTVVLPNGTYHWRARARGRVMWSGYSDTWTVTVDAPPPPQQWTAYNDCVYESGDTLGANVTTISLNESGLLLDQATGIPVGITAQLVGSSGTSTGTAGANTAEGTDAYSTFASFADMKGLVYYAEAPGWTVDLILSGLDPDRQYMFATSVSRYEDYTDRHTRFTLLGVDTAVNASTPGVGENNPLSVWFETGNNHAEGYVARWQDIDPGEDGSFTVRAEPQTEVYNTYAFSVFMLHEQVSAAPDVPVLVAPEDNATVDDSTPTFDWEDVAGATEYQIQIADDDGFTDPAIDTTTSDSTYMPDTTLPNGTFYWHVRAGNDSTWSEYSEARTVIVAALPPAPVLVAPANGAPIDDLTPTFDWSDVADVSYYYLQVSNNAEFVGLQVNTWTVASAYTPTTALGSGTYYWRVKTRDTMNTWGGWSETWSVSLNGQLLPAPELVSPENGSTTNDLTPLFDWSEVEGASYYHLQIDDDADFSSLLFNYQAGTSAYAIGPSLISGTYYWRVQACDAMNTCGVPSTSWSIVIDGELPPVPELLSPVDGSTTNDLTPTFDWSDVADVSYYYLQVSDNAGFVGLQINTWTVGSTYTPTAALESGTYYWRVKARDTMGTWGPWGETWSVVLDGQLLPAPELVSPADGSMTNDLTPYFDWSEVEGASSYRLQIDDNADFSSPLWNYKAGTSAYAVGAPLVSGTYYWRVQTCDTTDTCGVYSTSWSIVIDGELPPAPELLSPVDGSTTDDLTPTFDWSDVADVSYYYLQVSNNAEFVGLQINTWTVGSAYTPTTALESGTYYWRVKTRDTMNTWGGWSETWTLTLSDETRLDISLNSDWRFYRADVAGAEAVGFDDSGWTSLDLPHTWNNLDGQDGGDNYYRGIGWYRTHYTIPSDYAGKRIFLRFEAVSMVADVYVNGTLVGRHEGAFAAFAFDITDAITVGADNVIAVKANNAYSSTIAPLSGDFNLDGGIYRPVHLLVTDEVHITLLDYGSPGVYLTPTNVSAGSADLQVDVKVDNDSDTLEAVTVQTTILDAAGATIDVLTSTQDIDAGSGITFTQNTAVANPHLWNARSDPYLYRAIIEVRLGSTLVDAVEQPLGFRFFEVDPETGFYLNGDPLDLHGVAMHEGRKDKGRAISDDDRVEDIGLIMEMGATFVRLAHYQHAETIYDLADENGLVLWTEIPMVNYSGHYSDAFSANIKEQLRELVRQNYNHPSVFFWGLYNEGPLLEFSLISELNDLAHEEDATRLTTAANHNRISANQSFPTDLVSWNMYLGWYQGVMADLTSALSGFHTYQPYVGVSEYGAGASIYQHEEAPSPPDPYGDWHPEEYQNLFHESYWKQMADLPFLWNTAVWAAFDFAVDSRMDGDAPGYNDKGLITLDRSVKKDAFYWYKANWSDEPVVYITSRRFTTRDTSPVEVKVYSNCDSVELLVNEVSQGSLTSTDHIYRWIDVILAGGDNAIRAVCTIGAEQHEDSVVWQYSSP